MALMVQVNEMLCCVVASSKMTVEVRANSHTEKSFSGGLLFTSIGSSGQTARVAFHF